MEQRVKTLYIITIIVILAFLGMQVYWLLGRYTYTLTEAEDKTEATVLKVINDYNTARQSQFDTISEYSGLARSKFNLNYDFTSNGKTRRTITIISRKFHAHDLLGIPHDRKLTEEEMLRATEIIMNDMDSLDLASEKYDASNAPSDAAIMDAFKHLDLERYILTEATKLDSLLKASGVNADISLTVADSDLWLPTVIRHSTLLHPKMNILIPYSELERKCVFITCRISTADVLAMMARSLIAAAVLSGFLIACLMVQVSTVVKLSRLDTMRNSFVTTMIHELKRPISTLKMCVSGLENERMVADTSTRHELTVEMRGALDNLAAYFSKPRDITFNNVEQIPLNITSVNLHELVENMRMLTTDIPGKDVIFSNEIDPGMAIQADATHLLNIMSNLVENGVKYSGAEVEIAVAATTKNDFVEITVRDTGNGISTTDLRHIFTRFYRGKAQAGELPGMGLGLTYVKLLTEAHGGTIAVESIEGKGTIFTIILPQ